MVKLTDAQRFELYRAILPAVIALEPKTTPPNKGGEAKQGARDFCAAAWAMRYLRSAVYVLEKDEGAKGAQESPAAAGSSQPW